MSLSMHSTIPPARGASPGETLWAGADGAKRPCYSSVRAACAAAVCGGGLGATEHISQGGCATAIVQQHGAYAWRTLRLLGVRPADLDDVTQEVLLTAVRRRHTYEGRGTLRAWIRGICVKKAAGHRRRAHVRREVLSDALPELASCHRPDDALSHSRQLRELSRALDNLSERQRAAFVLYEIEGLSMKEVARALGCPLQTAYARHRAARNRIIAEMRRQPLMKRPPSAATEAAKRRHRGGQP